MADCPFCKMISGELAGSFVYQDSICSALMSMQPINPGHVLLMPNDHLADLSELPEETAQHLFSVGRRLAASIRSSGVDCEGINLYLADGRAAGQTIPHLQMHIIPRFENDGFELNISPRGAELPIRENLENNAFHIRQTLKDLNSLE